MQSDERLMMERAIQHATDRLRDWPDRLVRLIYGILRSAEIHTE